MRRQQIRQDAPVGLAAEDVTIEVAGSAETLLHAAALRLTPDAAADQQGAVNIEEDDSFHSAMPCFALRKRIIYSLPSMTIKEASAAPARTLIAA